MSEQEPHAHLGADSSHNPGDDSVFRRQPQQQRSQERIEQILQAAAEVFWEKGYDVATTHDIAERAQTAVGTLYRFFPNKLAIFHALEKRHRQHLEITNAQFLSLEMSALPLAVIIRQIVGTYAEYFKDLAPRVVYIQYALTPNIFLYFDDSFDHAMMDSFSKLLRSRNPALSTEKSELLSQVFLSTYQALLLVALRSDDTRRDQLQLEIQDVLRNYLEPYVGDRILSQYQAIQQQAQTLAQTHGLNHRQQVAIAHALNHGSLNIQTFSALCPNPSRRTLQRDLKQLVEKGLLSTQGDTNQLTYHIQDQHKN